jgi:hypothetical protein
MTVSNFTTYDEKRPPATAKSAAEVMVATARHTLTLTLAQAVVAGDILRACVLPANHVMVDAILDTDDLDNAASLDIDMGLINDAGTALLSATSFIDGSTAHQAAYRSEFKHPASSALKTRSYHETDTTRPVDRIVALLFNAAPDTAKAGAIEFKMMYRAADPRLGE